jgi:hypothetical protein
VKRLIDTGRLISAVKTLHITLYFLAACRYHVLSTIGHSLKYDFSALDRLDQHKQLQEVRFCLMFQGVRVMSYWGGSMNMPGAPSYDEMIWKRLAPELSRIGTLSTVVLKRLSTAA